MNTGFNIKKLLSHLCDSYLPLNRWINGRYIIALHRVLPADLVKKQYVQDCMYITPRTFDNIIEWMMTIGEVVSISKILNFEKPNKIPLFAITFDDGWEDNYVHAFPIIKKYNIPATIFLTTHAVDTGILFWPEEVISKINISFRQGNYLAVSNYLNKKVRKRQNTNQLIDNYLEQLKLLSERERKSELELFYAEIGANNGPIFSSVLTWDQIKEMSDFGITFGSHTHTHAILKYCDNIKVRNELKNSKKIIEQKIGRKVDLFSYPNARYSIENAKMVAQYYQFAFRLHNLPLKKNDSRYFLPRILVSEKICEGLSYLKLRFLCGHHF
jgi:peptidoglycan/xylan/chitin deacetylase (PgdA/CDA1 family)